jgi:hypothetical protein
MVRDVRRGVAVDEIQFIGLDGTVLHVVVSGFNGDEAGEHREQLLGWLFAAGLPLAQSITTGGRRVSGKQKRPGRWTRPSEAHNRTHRGQPR